MPKKGGSGIVEGLWAGTAVFAATKSRTFAGFVTSFLLYSVVLVVGMMLVAVLIRTVTGREMFSMAEIRCPAGSNAVEKCPGTGTPGCLHASGNCEASLGQ